MPNGNYQVAGTANTLNPESGAVNIAIAGGAVEGPTMMLTKSISIDVNVREEFSSTSENVAGTYSGGPQTFTVRGPRLYLQVWAIPVDEFGPQFRGSIRPPHETGRQFAGARRVIARRILVSLSLGPRLRGIGHDGLG